MIFVDFGSGKHEEIDVRLICRATHDMNQGTNGHKIHACMYSGASLSVPVINLLSFA